MMTQEIPSPRHDRPEDSRPPVVACHLVLVASVPPRLADGPGQAGPGRRGPQPPVAGPRGLRCTRIPANAVGGSAAWCRRLSGRRAGVSPRFAEPIGCETDRIEGLSALLAAPGRSDGPGDGREAIAGAITALRSADAVITGPLSPEDANAPGLLPHLADLAGRAYRALRPPSELVVHPAFAQAARRFHFIQMSDRRARALGAGAVDLRILADRLRQLQGDAGEFAITAFGGRGLLRADDAWWEIEPIGDADEAVAGAVFCTAWVVARRFGRAGAAQALAYARAAAAATVPSITGDHTARAEDNVIAEQGATVDRMGFANPILMTMVRSPCAFGEPRLQSR